MPVLVGLGASGTLIEKDKKSGFYSWMNTLMTEKFSNKDKWVLNSDF